MLENLDPLRKEEGWRKQKATARSAVFLAAALVASGIQGQSRRSTHVPDHFEYFEGHGYMGGEWVKWEQETLIFTKRVTNMNGSFHETIERLEPPEQAWERFWARMDSLGVWEWKSDYSSSNSSLPDGESWSLTLGHGAKEVKSKGYNAVPEAYGAFRRAVHDLMGDARRR